jgi:hypothetical protein
MPLLKERLDCLREAAQVLEEVWRGPSLTLSCSMDSVLT